MAKLSLVGIKGIRIEPDNGGYRVLGEYCPTLPGAIKYAQRYEVPEEDEVNDTAGGYDDPQEKYEDLKLAREARNNRWLDKMYPI